MLKCIPPSLVTPSTSTFTSNPKLTSISERSILVSSTTSCNRPAAITDELAPISLRRSATAIGWIIYGSPLARSWPLCALYASLKAFTIRF